MKKRIINLIVAFVFTSMAAIASNTPSITIAGEKAIVVDTKNWKAASLNVEISNQDGKLVFDDELTMDKAKKFNFQNLVDGTYTVTLSDDYKTTIQDFIIKANKIELVAELETNYKPIITLNEDYIDLNYMSKGEKTSISIFDSNNTVFSVKVENEASINKRLNISDLPKGSYTVYVSSDKESTWKKFRI
ncbi:MAG: hypothetical protein P1U56_01020 [Saprospiraceae bacterium]|nr:hypothetical protein [Saprospiraceae bacterium]